MKKLFLISVLLFGIFSYGFAQEAGKKATAIKIGGSKKPVYVIDGIKQSPYGSFALTDLKVETIEEIKIVKSEEALKLFGSEAIDGAVIVITKAGKKIPSSLALDNKIEQLNFGKGIAGFSASKFSGVGVNNIDTAGLGNRPGIIIRGLNTSGANYNDVVYILDGEKVEKDALSWLDPNTIATVSVLKKGSAISLYGPRANNGVVVITTKVKPVLKPVEKQDKN